MAAIGVCSFEMDLTCQKLGRWLFIVAQPDNDQAIYRRPPPSLLKKESDLETINAQVWKTKADDLSQSGSHLFLV